MDTELKITAAGKEYPVQISEEDGTFRVQLEGHGQISAASFAELERKARKIKVRFELPFSQLTADGVRHGKVTGLHATSGNILVRWDDGSTEQLPSWAGGSEVMPRLSHAETVTVAGLVRARNEARKDLDAYIAPRKYPSLMQAAKDAQAKAVARGE